MTDLISSTLTGLADRLQFAFTLGAGAVVVVAIVCVAAYWLTWR